MWWLLIPGVVLLLGFLPIGFLAGFDQNGAKLSVKIGVLRFPVGAKKEKKEKEKTGNAKKFESKETVRKKKSSKDISRYFTLIQPVFKFLADFKRRLRVNDLRLKVIMGGSDPCDLSVNYGRAWIALGNLMPMLERFLVIKKRDLEIECDYTLNTTQYQGNIDITITLCELLQIVIYHGISILKEYFRIIKQAKDGAMS